MTENEHTDFTRRVNPKSGTKAKTNKQAKDAVATERPRKTERRRGEPVGVIAGMVLPRKKFQQDMNIGDDTFKLWWEMGLPVYDNTGTQQLIITDDLISFLRAHPEFRTIGPPETNHHEE